MLDSPVTIGVGLTTLPCVKSIVSCCDAARGAESAPKAHAARSSHAKDDMAEPTSSTISMLDTSLPLSRLAMATIMSTMPAPTRKWYWIVKKKSNFLLRRGLVARFLIR